MHDCISYCKYVKSIKVIKHHLSENQDFSNLLKITKISMNYSLDFLFISLFLIVSLFRMLLKNCALIIRKTRGVGTMIYQ